MGSKTRDSVWRSIWLACVWNIWTHRNNIVFQGVQPDWAKVLEGLKSHSWFWIRNLGKGLIASYSDWSREPIACLQGVGAR